MNDDDNMNKIVFNEVNQEIENLNKSEKKKENENLAETQKDFSAKNKVNNTINKKNDSSYVYLLVSYCFCIFVSGFQWLSFSCIPFFSFYYELDQWKIDFFSLIYIIEYLILFIPEILLLEKLSTKNMFRISALLIIIGSFFKIFINKDSSLTICYLGQIISGLSRPYLMIIPGDVAKCFKANIKNFICILCCLSDISGILIGYIWNLAYIKKEELDIDIYKDHVYRYFLSEFILVFIMAIPAIFIEENELINKTISSKKNELIKFGKEALISLFKNSKFILILISSFFIGGYYYVMSFKFIHLVSIYDIDKKKSDIIYSISVVIGIACALVLSFIIDKYKKYKIILIILSLLSLISQALLAFLLELAESRDLNAYAISFIFYILINGSAISFYCIIMAYIDKIAYPVTKYISFSFIIAATQIYNICGHFLYKYILENTENKYICNILFSIFFFVGTLVSFFGVREEHNNEVEEENKKSNNNIDNVILIEMTSKEK